MIHSVKYNYIYQQQNAIYNNVVWHFYADGCKAEMADEKKEEVSEKKEKKMKKEKPEKKEKKVKKTKKEKPNKRFSMQKMV